MFVKAYFLINCGLINRISMIDISTKYLGLNLKNPIIAASSGLSGTIEGVKHLADSSVGAIVLKSIFEEQILHEAYVHVIKGNNDYLYPEAIDYIKNYIKLTKLDSYLNLIRKSKKITDIPIIASINCVTSSEWTDFAEKIESAGADAIELNVFLLPTDEKLNSHQTENIYFDIAEKVRNKVKIPIALKISSYSARLSQLIKKLSRSGNIDGLVLFNRGYSPDIDIDTLQITSSNIYSSAEEISNSLRWIALMRDKVNCDLAASTGIHNGAGVIKQLLAGANAVQIASALYLKGTEIVPDMLNELQEWMIKNDYQSIEQFRGIIKKSNFENPAAFERVQFMKYYSKIE